MDSIYGHGDPVTKIACNSCSRYHKEDMEAFSCDAFNNIPDEILSGKNMHKAVLEGQTNDITYAPID